MKCPPLFELFAWKRVVTDEFTYLEGNQGSQPIDKNSYPKKFLPAAQPAAGLQAAFHFLQFSQVRKVAKNTNKLKKCWNTKLIGMINKVC